MSERMWEELQETRAERDRLQRELEALRKMVEDLRFRDGWYLAGRIATRIDAILRGVE